MANHDDIGNACRYFLIGIGRTKNDIIGNIICQGMVVADDNQIIVLLGFFPIGIIQDAIFCRIREFLTLNDIVGTNNKSMIYILGCIIITINHIILAANIIYSRMIVPRIIKIPIFMIRITSQFIVNTNNL